MNGSRSTRRYAQTLQQAKGDVAAGQAAYAVCSSCHGAKGEGNKDLGAPKLAGQGAWYLTRQLHDFKSGVRGTQEQDTYGKQMVPFAATLVDEAAVRNVVAYIASLPDVRPESTVHGDPTKGKKLYETCTVCHGANGQGNWGTNAPRLSNMSDWYMARQLQNFRSGIRGRHAQDFHGAQMAAMAKPLADDQAINDLIDYIHTL